MTRPFDANSSISTDAKPAGQMADALRVLALGLGDVSFAGLSVETTQRLSSACAGFADLIQAGEDAPLAGMSLRSGPCFLLSALSTLRGAEGRLSALDETWMISEVERELAQSVALFEARTGRSHAPSPSRAPFAWVGLPTVGSNDIAFDLDG